MTKQRNAFHLYFVRRRRDLLTMRYDYDDDNDDDKTVRMTLRKQKFLG